MAIVDLRAGRVGDAAAHLREQLQIAMQTGLRPTLLAGLDGRRHRCAATRRTAEAVTGPCRGPGGASEPMAEGREHRPVRRQIGRGHDRTAYRAENSGPGPNGLPLPTAADAVTVILDGVRPGTWRILVGEDAKMIDAAVRAKPEAACDYAELFSKPAEEPATATPDR